MERITKKFSDGTFYCEDIEDVGIKGVNAPTFVGKAINKLAEYEDAEEQGLLLRLPCKVGDKAYLIDKDENGHLKVYEGVWDIVAMVQGKNANFEVRGHISYGVYDFFYDDGRTMLHGMYVGQENTKFGKVVFLTREEAEQALAEMNGV